MCLPPGASGWALHNLSTCPFVRLAIVFSRSEPPDWEIISYCMAVYGLLSTSVHVTDMASSAMLAPAARSSRKPYLLPPIASMPFTVPEDLHNLLRVQDRSTRLLAQLQASPKGRTLLLEGGGAGTLLELMHSPSQYVRINATLILGLSALAHPAETAKVHHCHI
jgi:hypothetical protein